MSSDALAKAWGQAMGTDRKQFNMFFEKMMDGFAYHKIVLDNRGKPVDYIFLEVNHAFEKLTGLRREKIIGKKVTEVLPGIENDPADWISVYGSVALTGEPVQFENYAKPLGKWYDISAYCPEKGYFVALFEDITSRKDAEAALRASEENYKHLLNYAPTAIYEIDYKFPRFKSVNDAMCQLTGYSREMLLKMNPADLLDSESRQRFIERIRKGLSGERIDEAVEYRAVVKDGRELWIILNVKPTYKDGKIDGALVVGHDITERKKAERALRESEERFKVIASSTPDHLLVQDNELRYTMVLNPQLGLTEKDMIGKTDYDILPEEDADKLTKIKRQVLETGRTVTIEMPLISKKGEQQFFSGSYVPKYDTNGKIDGLIGYFRNMTEHKKTEEALRESEEQLRKAVEGAPIPTIMQAEDGQVLQISHSWTDLTGYTINHVRSFDEWITKAVYGEGANQVRDHLHELFRGDKRSIGEEFTLLTLKGDSRYWSFSASSPGALRDGRRFIVGMAVDITELKQMQEKLEEYAKNLEGLVEERTKKLETSALYARGLLEASLDPLVTINAEGKITDVNKATETATGCSREELVGSDFSDYFTQPDEARKGYLQVFQNGFVRDYSLSIRSKSGNIVEVLYNATLFRNEAGEVEGVFAAARDMTEHNKAEEALLNERKRLFDVLETLPAMVCILTPDHHVDFANRSFRDRFGNSEGRYCYDYCFGNKEPCIFCESYKPLETGKPHHWEVNAPDGSVIDAYDFPFTDVDGSTKILEMDIDITERRRMEKQLKDSERLTAIGTTAGMVGHDIRNPLQAIASDVYLAKSDLSSMPDGEAKEGLKESLDGIDKNIEYINKIVQDLQDFARPIKPNAQETSLEGLCEDVLLSNMVPENIDASCHVEKKVKKIVTDPAVLKRVLSNLVNNAFQAMPEGGKIYVRAYQEAGDTVITVQDTGGGIPEDVKSKLFTPLFTTKSKGQGFGLAVIKRMTEALGGTVSYESKVGEGTKFFIRLPSPKELNGKWVFK